MRMQRSPDVDLLAAFVAASQKLEVSSNRSAFLVVHFSCSLVTDPCVSTSPSGVNPEDMLEAKVFSQRSIDDFDGHCDESPTLLANVGAGTASSDLIVICHIDIKNQLFCNRTESTRFAKRFSVSWVCRVLGTDFETCGE